MYKKAYIQLLLKFYILIIYILFSIFIWPSNFSTLYSILYFIDLFSF